MVGEVAQLPELGRTHPARLLHRVRTHVRPAALHLATGCLLLAVAMSVATCRLDKLVTPAFHDRLVVTPAALFDSAHTGSSDSVPATLQLASLRSEERRVGKEC